MGKLRAMKRARSSSTILALALVIAAAAAPDGSAAQSVPRAAEPAEPAEPAEEVVVQGKHEGPRMWRISKDNHVMWILGTISPLPKKMTWQSDSVEEVLQQTQEVLPAWPSIGVGA